MNEGLSRVASYVGSGSVTVAQITIQEIPPQDGKAYTFWISWVCSQSSDEKQKELVGYFSGDDKAEVVRSGLCELLGVTSNAGRL